MTTTGLGLRLAGLTGAVLLAIWASSVVRESLDLVVMPPGEAAAYWSVLTATAAYVLLLSVPFVPGAEIGLTLLTVFGAPIAPLVYCATVAALMLSYGVGRLVPTQRVVAGLHWLRLTRAAEGVARMAPLSHDERIARILQGGSPRLIRFATRYRYLALILAVNTPGNVVIGGGGGIALMAGMSRLFAPLPYFLAVAIAVAPIPLAVALFGR